MRTKSPLRLLLSRAISFHPVLVDLCEGSITAALFLSQAIYYSEITDGEDGWFWKKSKEWEMETKLSRREQESAREKLSRLGFINEQLRNSPPVMHYRVDFNLLETAILNMAETAKLDGGNRQINMAETAKSYKEAKITTETTTEITNIKPKAQFNLPPWINPENWADFEEMRKKIRKPMTDRARNSIVKELMGLSARGHPPDLCLEQSIRNCWQDVFELRDKVNGNGQTSKADRRSAQISEATDRIFRSDPCFSENNAGCLPDKNLGQGNHDLEGNSEGLFFPRVREGDDGTD